MPTFHFKLSYQDQCAYSVYGSPVREIEAYRAPQHTIDYMRECYNHGGDPTCFEREVMRRQGGAAIRSAEPCTWPYRWTPELYAAFVQWLKDEHARQWKEIETWRGRNNLEFSPEEITPLDIPRPIYFDPDSHQWETEPWYRPTGCGKPTHVEGTNGGMMPCGAMLTKFGKNAPYLCVTCSQQAEDEPDTHGPAVAANKHLPCY